MPKDMGTIRIDYGIKPVPTSQDSISIDANTRYQKVIYRYDYSSV